MINKKNIKEFEKTINDETELLFNKIIENITEFDKRHLSPEDNESGLLKECSLGNKECNNILKSALKQFIMDRYLLTPT